MNGAGIELELAALFCFVFLSVLRLSDWSIIYVTQNSSENCFSDPNMQKVGEIACTRYMKVFYLIFTPHRHCSVLVAGCLVHFAL